MADPPRLEVVGSHELFTHRGKHLVGVAIGRIQATHANGSGLAFRGEGRSEDGRSSEGLS